MWKSVRKFVKAAITKLAPGAFTPKQQTPASATSLPHTTSASSWNFWPSKWQNGKMAMAVPDPEPRLLEANAAEPAKLQLLFRPSRKYMASTHFIHVRVPFNFSKLLNTPAKIFEHYQIYIDKWPEPFRTQVDEVADISQSCHADKLNNFTNILVALPEYEVVTRDKRFLDLVSFGMSAAALSLATFNTAKISHLEMQIAHNNKQLDHLVEITTLHEQHFKAADKKLDDVSDKLAMLLKILPK
jgi:hypothetical protein